MKVLKENCTLEDAQDTKLPYTAYLVQYKVDGKDRYNLSVATKAVDLFDYYYDLYKKDFVSFRQAEGRVPPARWRDPNEPVPPKKKGKRK